MSDSDESNLPILMVMLMGEQNIKRTTFAFCWKENAPADRLDYDSLMSAYLHNPECVCKGKLRVGDQDVMVKFMESACPEELPAIAEMACEDMDIFLLLFSYQDVNSLERIRSKWAPLIIRAVTKPRAMMLVGLRDNVRENYQEFEAMGESPFGESPVKDEMIQEVMREIGADCFVECCPKINYNIQEAMTRAVEIFLEVEQKGLEGKKGPGKHCGSQKSSKCNVA